MVVETSYQMFEDLLFCDQKRAVPPSITITVLNFLVKKDNEEFRGLYFWTTRKNYLGK